MRTYGQFCPIARGSEILAERWTPIILRNLLLGCRTFNEIAAGAPGLSRALLARRLRELERVGVLEIRPKPSGRGSVYEPTPAGKDLAGVLEAIGGWAERWTEMQGEHADPDVVLWSWSQTFLRRDLLPDRRVVVRFEFTRHARRCGSGCWPRGARSRSVASTPASATTWWWPSTTRWPSPAGTWAGSSGQRRCATARSP